MTVTTLPQHCSHVMPTMRLGSLQSSLQVVLSLHTLLPNPVLGEKPMKPCKAPLSPLTLWFVVFSYTFGPQKLFFTVFTGSVSNSISSLCLYRPCYHCQPNRAKPSAPPSPYIVEVYKLCFFTQSESTLLFHFN